MIAHITLAVIVSFQIQVEYSLDYIYTHMTCACVLTKYAWPCINIINIDHCV